MFAINVTCDADLQVRLNVLSEVSPDGQTLITQTDAFSLCVNAAVYRVSATRFPIPAGSIELKGLTNPILTTNSGKYSNSLSSIVSERVTLIASYTFIETSA